MLSMVWTSLGKIIISGEFCLWMNRGGCVRIACETHFRGDKMSKDFPTEDMTLTHILVVSDLDRARIFYREILGASLYGEYGGTSIVFDFNGAWLLVVTGGGPTADKPDITFAPPENPNRVSHALTIRVKDCQGAYETLKDRGAEFLTPPVNHGYEIRAFFRDPDGHLFEISQVEGLS
jgi:catechol 2,3-dioxygenase-like lactoylglutathione lyase family enzyme